ncbi:MAG: type VII toxin-antitoxin system HepT family RNase toxin [Candidatus Thorarchaeota archaeon]
MVFILLIITISLTFHTEPTKYRLIVALEAAISVCNHIVARALKKIPSSYSECFTSLNRHKIISDDLAKELSSMAKFRNLVVQCILES